MTNKSFLARLLAIILIINPILSATNTVFAQTPKETDIQKDERMKWWRDARFGMFIHWGLYSMPSRHEWVKKYERLTNEEYQKYFELFNPDMYNPREWAKTAKEAGMKYAVITTKHHEGFCLFDSRFTDYKSTNTPYGKDLLKEWVDAFRAEDIKIGFYYSLLDWHHPDYTIDRNHPQSQTSDSAYAAVNKGKNMDVYREYVKNQVTELLTNYGEVSIIWLDYSFPGGKDGKGREDWDSENLLKLVRKLQPGILVNDRMDLTDVEGGWDFKTPEQYKVSKWPEVNNKRVPWETCQTFSGSWGYYRDENTWKSSKQLLVLLIESVSKGGNLLLNVGPTSRGNIDYRALERLKSIGDWMKYNNRSIYGCTQAPEEFQTPENCILTYNPETRRIYIHCIDWPMGALHLKGFQGKIKYIQMLHDGSEIQLSKSEGYWNPEKRSDDILVLSLPVVKPNIEIPVIEIILK